MAKNELADKIINDGVFPMCSPILKLQAMAAFLYNATEGPNQIEDAEIKGAANILRDISCELQEFSDKAHAIHEGKGDED